MGTKDEKLLISLVGGTWDEFGGKKSSYVSKLSYALIMEGTSTFTFNGGNFESLSTIVEREERQLFGHSSVIIWIANVPNHLPKPQSIKNLYPKALLVTSKRNNNEYSLSELVNRALLSHSNLCVDFRKDDNGMISSRIYDPLGVVWLDYTEDIHLLAKMLVSRLRELKSFTRQGSTQIDMEPIIATIDPHFLSLIKEYAEVFHSLILPANGVNRFLGNSSFRCMRGFPSTRDKVTGNIFVSRRNVDKRFIGVESFVCVKNNGPLKNISYWGPNKPSVDSPIQLQLYEKLPNINYMIHGHVYIKGAPTTSRIVPCGAIEEVNEILTLISDHETEFACVNLLGHGCLVMANRPHKMTGLKFKARPSPEYLTI